MRRVPECRECGTKCEQTGRNTWFCPECDVCPECECPNADGFTHYAGCESAEKDAADEKNA